MKTLTPAPRTSTAAHVLRVALFSAALSAIATIVAADVLAAEPDALGDAALAVLDLDDDDEALLDEGDAGPALYAAAIQIPDAAAPVAEPDLAELLAMEPKVEKKKKRKGKKSKLFGRFEGY